MFAYLGRHRLAEGDEVVRFDSRRSKRGYRERAAAANPSCRLKKIDERGFFVAVLPDDAPDYASLRIRYTGRHRASD